MSGTRTSGGWLGGLATLLALALSASALAGPCEAIPDRGPTPAWLRYNAAFSGPVTQVLDGDSLCVAVGPGPGPGPQNLVEVRLADFYAPEMSERQGAAAKAALSRIALGREARCVAGLRSYDRIVARCTIGGAPIGDLMRQAGVVEGGRGASDPGVRVVRGPGASAPSAATPPGAFRSCAQARAAGAAPLRRGAPGYNPHLDGDGDGVACEPYRGR